MAQKKFNVFEVPALERHELVALQMTADPEENAEPEQQAIAIKVICEKICLMDIQPIQFGAPDETGFINGRVFVGKEIFRQRRRPIGEMDANDKNA
jgi:hypothetical protein